MTKTIIYLLGFSCFFLITRLGYAANIQTDSSKSQYINSQGVLKAKSGNYYSALQNFLKSAEISKQNKDTNNLVIAFNNIAFLYHNLNEHEKSIFYYRKALFSCDSVKDRKNWATGLNNIGVEFIDLDSLDKAIIFLNRASKIYKQQGLELGYAYTLKNLGKAILKKGFLDKALNYFLQSYKIAKRKNDPNCILISSMMTGKIMLSQKKDTAALLYFNESLKNAMKLKDIFYLRDIYKILAMFYKERHVIDSTNKYLEKYATIKDSIYQFENGGKIAELEFNQKVKEKNKENELLSQKSKLASLKAKRNKEQRNFFIMLSGIALILGFAGFKISHDRKKLNKLISTKNKELIDVNTQLQKINDTKDKLFALISHDLKIPASSLQKFSGSLAKNFGKYEVSEVKEIASIINTLSEQMSNLLDELLTWAKIQTGRLKCNEELICINDELIKTLEIFDHKIKTKNIKLNISLEDNFKFKADRAMLLSIFRNLISNALKYTPRQGFLKIKGWTENELAYMTFIDNGIGMKPEDLKMLFRIDKIHSKPGLENEDGNGLGMAIVKEMLELNNASIEVESYEGKGTNITLTFHQK